MSKNSSVRSASLKLGNDYISSIQLPLPAINNEGQGDLHHKEKFMVNYSCKICVTHVCVVRFI